MPQALKRRPYVMSYGCSATSHSSRSFLLLPTHVSWALAGVDQGARTTSRRGGPGPRGAARPRGATRVLDGSSGAVLTGRCSDELRELVDRELRGTQAAGRKRGRGQQLCALPAVLPVPQRASRDGRGGGQVGLLDRPRRDVHGRRGAQAGRLLRGGQAALREPGAVRTRSSAPCSPAIHPAAIRLRGSLRGAGTPMQRCRGSAITSACTTRQAHSLSPVISS